MRVGEGREVQDGDGRVSVARAEGEMVGGRYWEEGFVREWRGRWGSRGYERPNTPAPTMRMDDGAAGEVDPCMVWLSLRVYSVYWEVESAIGVNTGVVVGGIFVTAPPEWERSVRRGNARGKLGETFLRDVGSFCI